MRCLPGSETGFHSDLSMSLDRTGRSLRTPDSPTQAAPPTSTPVSTAGELERVGSKCPRQHVERSIFRSHSLALNTDNHRGRRFWVGGVDGVLTNGVGTNFGVG